MTATEELRRMLDERVVEWWPLGSNMTECVIDGIRYKFRQVGSGLIVSTCTEGTVTPEQAIAATLGRGTCEMEYVSDFMSWHCKACGQMDMAPRNPKPRYCKWCGRKVVLSE